MSLGKEIVLRACAPGDEEALALMGAATFLEAFTWMLPGADIVAHCARHHTAQAYARCPRAGHLSHFKAHPKA